MILPWGGSFPGTNSIFMSKDLLGGKLVESSSEKTFSNSFRHSGRSSEAEVLKIEVWVRELRIGIVTPCKIQLLET